MMSVLCAGSQGAGQRLLFSKGGPSTAGCCFHSVMKMGLQGLALSCKTRLGCRLLQADGSAAAGCWVWLVACRRLAAACELPLISAHCFLLCRRA